MMTRPPTTSAVKMANRGGRTVCRHPPFAGPTSSEASVVSGTTSSRVGSRGPSSSISGTGAETRSSGGEEPGSSGTGRLLLDVRAGHEQPQLLPGGLAGRKDGHDLPPEHDRDPIGQGQDLVQLG